MSKIFLITTCIIGILILTSCKTYIIPLESFKKQFEEIDSTDFRMVSIDGATHDSYLANPIKKINCFDKKGNPHELSNSPKVEIRFTYGEKNKRTIFYFDRVILIDTIVIGAKSRFIPSMIKSIPYNSVSKIEIQNGSKNFKYVEE